MLEHSLRRTASTAQTAMSRAAPPAGAQLICWAARPCLESKKHSGMCSGRGRPAIRASRQSSACLPSSSVRSTSSEPPCVRLSTMSRFAWSYASRARASSARISSVASGWPGLKEWASKAAPKAVISTSASASAESSPPRHGHHLRSLPPTPLRMVAIMPHRPGRPADVSEGGRARSGELEHSMIYRGAQSPVCPGQPHGCRWRGAGARCSYRSVACRSNRLPGNVRRFGRLQRVTPHSRASRHPGDGRPSAPD